MPSDAGAPEAGTGWGAFSPGAPEGACAAHTTVSANGAACRPSAPRAVEDTLVPILSTECVGCRHHRLHT